MTREVSILCNHSSSPRKQVRRCHDEAFLKLFFLPYLPPHVSALLARLSSSVHPPASRSSSSTLTLESPFQPAPLDKFYSTQSTSVIALGFTRQREHANVAGMLAAHSRNKKTAFLELALPTLTTADASICRSIHLCSPPFAAHLRYADLVPGSALVHVHWDIRKLQAR